MASRNSHAQERIAFMRIMPNINFCEGKYSFLERGKLVGKFSILTTEKCYE